MTTVHIPDSLDEAVTELGAIGKIVTAREWERAAILATYVEPGEGQGARTSRTTAQGGLVSARAFARHGIHGLRSENTVLRYVQNWLDERPRPTPGETVDLDGLPDWPPDHENPARNITGEERRDRLIKQAEADGTGASKVLDIASNPKAMAAAIKGDPDVEAAARAALDQADAARRARLRPPPGTPEGKAAQAFLSNANDVAERITIPLGDACVVVERISREWDDTYDLLSENDKRVIHRTINNLIAAAEAVLLHMEVGNMT
jgi:hypothetical protein